MRTFDSALSLSAALLALSLGACAGEPAETAAVPATGSDSAAEQQRRAEAAAVIDQVTLAKRVGQDSATRFESSAPLELTLTELREGRQVLIQNPGGRRRLRITLDDRHETHPLSRVLRVVDTLPAARAGTRDRPGTVLVELTSAPGDKPKEGTYEGLLVLSDSAGGPRAERIVRISVPTSLPAVSDTGWTASIHKVALSPPLRAWLFSDAEGRCARDTRQRQGFATTDVARWGRSVMGTCTRDNVIPLTATPSRRSASPDSAAQAKKDSARESPTRVLLGVLHAEKRADQALVWWTGDSLRVDGMRQGVELQFTSFDHPGTYYGKIDLARAGAEGIVGLRVRVTHDWPLALLAIGLGVFLSWWLRNYVRTRRAVLKMQETAADLVSRIEAANEQLRLVDSNVSGYQAYPVDDKLLTGLRQLERQLQQHAYDGTVLEPGKPEHDALRQQLEKAEQDVVTWEGFAAVLGDLRLALATAEELEEQLGRDEIPVLLSEVEKLFDGTRLATADVAALDERAARDEEAVRCWNEVAQDAVALKNRLESATEEDEGRAAAEAALAAAITELWKATDATTAKAVGPRVAAAARLFRPRQTVMKLFGGLSRSPGEKVAVDREGGSAPPLPPSGPDRADAQQRLREMLTTFGATETPVLTGGGAGPSTFGELAELISQLPDGVGLGALTASEESVSTEPERPRRDYAALRARREKEAKLRQRAAELRKQAESRRKWSDRKYLALTLIVAAATGLNQLYFKDDGFGTMQDYMVALLWGFGIKLGLDTVRGAVEAGKLPWPFAGNAQPAQQTQSGQTQTQSGQTQTQQAQTGQTQTGQTQTGQTQQTQAGQGGGAAAPGGAAPKPVVPDDKPAAPPQGEGDPEKDGEQAPAPAAERVRSPEELAAAG